MSKNYRTKPQNIKAVKWTGENVEEVKEFLKERYIANTEDHVFFHQYDHVSSIGLARFATKGDYIFTKDGNLFERKKDKDFEEVYEEVNENE